jgi:hypothetical protein
MEVLGTSGYDFYHVEDLDSIVECHKLCKKIFFSQKNIFLNFLAKKKKIFFFGCKGPPL